MKRIFTLLILLGLMNPTITKGQQDPMFTKYMFNPLQYNPGYAGSVDALDLVLLHRHQWWGIEGAPMSQSFSIHSPISKHNIAVGLQLGHDQIAVSRSFQANASIAYRIRFGDPKDKGGHISIGLQGGVDNWYSNWSNLRLEDQEDPIFTTDAMPSLWLPNFGAGLYVHTKQWFVGLSVPKLITNRLRNLMDQQRSDEAIAQQYRHYYLTAGGAINLGTSVVFRPSLLIKNVGLFVERNNVNKVGAPTEFDIDLGFLINKMFWVGASFRSSFELFSGNSSYDSADLWLALRLKNGIRIGLAYDYTLTKLQKAGQGTYEVMLGYDLLRLDEDKISHNRFF